jgi:hypothetical protein
MRTIRAWFVARGCPMAYASASVKLFCSVGEPGQLT